MGRKRKKQKQRQSAIGKKHDSEKEIDQDSVKLMMNILNRYFSDHQIIIVSIFEYDLDLVKQIEIVNTLIEIENRQESK